MKKLKKLLSVLLVIALILGMSPARSYAEEEGSGPAEAPEQVLGEGGDEVVYATGYVPTLGEALPASQLSGLNQAGVNDLYYSSVTAGRLGAVKNQDPYGTCWANSLTTCAEATLKENESLSAIRPLSVLQEAAFCYEGSHDPLGNASSDVITPIFNEEQPNVLELGGNNQIAMISVAAWDNAALDSTFPYTTANANLIINGQAGKAQDYAYAAHAKSVQIFDVDDMVVSEEVSRVKALLLKYGAVSTGIGYYAPRTRYAQFPYHENAAYGTYYCNTHYSTNHSVTIVGWNDNYPLTNFGHDSTDRPQGNGAWLVQNSWGCYDASTSGNASNTGLAESRDGYFWMSYYEATREKSYAVYDYESSDKYQNNYMYDGGVSSTYVSGSSSYGATYQVNASSREKISGVSFIISNADISGTVTIIRNTDASHPLQGTRSTAVPFTTTYPGLYTVDIDGPTLERGEYYSIILEFEEDPWINTDCYQEYGDLFVNEPDYTNDRTFSIRNNNAFSIVTSNEEQTIRKNHTARIKGFTNNVYTVAYDANGGSGAPASQDKINKQDITLSSAVPTCSGFQFLGWSTNQYATTADYAPGDVYSEDGDKTLYAVWFDDSSPEYEVRVQSRIEGTDASVVNIKGSGSVRQAGGKYFFAPADSDAPSGFTFIGWYTGYSASGNGTLIDVNAITNFHPTADCELTAVYRRDHNEHVTVEYTDSQADFLYWADQNGNLFSRKKEFSYIPIGGLTLHAVTSASEGQGGSTAMALVVFKNADGQIISAKNYGNTETITFPEGNYSWDKTIQEIRAAMTGPWAVVVNAR